ncbi:unnamed protein product, partial [Adineta steineri]
MALPTLRTFVSTKLIGLNMFPLWAFGNNTNRVTATRLGQRATRLYIILLIISFAIIIFYTVIQPQILTKTFDKPSFDVYNRLARDHGTTLECSCSVISTTYDR